MLAHPQIKGTLLTHLVTALESDDPADFDIAAANIAARFADCETPMVGVAFGVPLQLANAATLLRNTWGISLNKNCIANNDQPHIQVLAELLPYIPPPMGNSDIDLNANTSEKPALVHA